MSYIRTKDGVYKVSEYNDYATHKRKDSTLVEKDKTSYIKNENIINQSENLEDLCDEFVMTHYFKETNYTHRKVLNEYEEMNLMIKAVRLKKINNKDKERKNEFNIYGCIWIEIKLPKHKTVFRLEPVVIMNDKGDFELI